MLRFVRRLVPTKQKPIIFKEDISNSDSSESIDYPDESSDSDGSSEGSFEIDDPITIDLSVVD